MSLTERTRPGEAEGLTQTFTGSDSGAPCVPCQCFNVAGVINYFLGKRLSRLTVTHISNLNKIDKGVLLLFTGPLPVAVLQNGPWRLGVCLGCQGQGVLEGKTAIFRKDYTI